MGLYLYQLRGCVCGQHRDSPATSTVLLMVDTAGCDMTELTTAENISKANEGEASIVYHHINELVELGVRVEDIAVVTPYNLQVELLRLLQVPISEGKGKEEKHCENTENETAEDMRRNEYEDILKQFV